MIHKNTILQLIFKIKIVWNIRKTYYTPKYKRIYCLSTGSVKSWLFMFKLDFLKPREQVSPRALKPKKIQTTRWSKALCGARGAHAIIELSLQKAIKGLRTNYPTTDLPHTRARLSLTCVYIFSTRTHRHSYSPLTKHGAGIYFPARARLIEPLRKPNPWITQWNYRVRAARRNYYFLHICR